MTAFLAAIWIALVFRAPEPGTSPLARYDAIRISGAGTVTTARLWRQPGDQSAVVPRSPGSAETVYVQVSEDPWNQTYGWRRGGSGIRIRARNAVGDTALWSNLVLMAYSARDTLFLDIAGSRWTAPTDGLYPGEYDGWRRTRPNPIKPSAFQVTWSRVYGDTLMHPANWPPWGDWYKPLDGCGPVVHAETVWRAAGGSWPPEGR
jgi:hypothetical protein